jgi:hypothetical protein
VLLAMKIYPFFNFMPPSSDEDEVHVLPLLPPLSGAGRLVWSGGNMGQKPINGQSALCRATKTPI